MRSVLVCETQVPFVDGGAERLVRGLVGELRRHGYRAETVSIPFKSYPKGELLAQAALWRLVDLSESNYESIDAVITTKFPNYFVRHPNKVTWLLHQYRAITISAVRRLSDFTDSEADVRLRDRLIGLDTEVLAESKRLLQLANHDRASGQVQRPCCRTGVSPAAARGHARRPGRSATMCCRWDGSS